MSGSLPKMAGANAGESSPRPSCVVAAGGTGPASRRYPVSVRALIIPAKSLLQRSSAAPRSRRNRHPECCIQHTAAAAPNRLPASRSRAARPGWPDRVRRGGYSSCTTRRTCAASVWPSVMDSDSRSPRRVAIKVNAPAGSLSRRIRRSGTPAIDGDRYPLSPRAKRLKSILAKLDPRSAECAVMPYPVPRPAAEPSPLYAKLRGGHRRR